MSGYEEEILEYQIGGNKRIEHYLFDYERVYGWQTFMIKRGLHQGLHNETDVLHVHHFWEIVKLCR